MTTKCLSLLYETKANVGHYFKYKIKKNFKKRAFSFHPNVLQDKIDYLAIENGGQVRFGGTHELQILSTLTYMQLVDEVN